MTPVELSPFLSRLLESDLRLSLMLWGPPGIGKSSIVASVARQHGLDLVDLRLSQLAPTDLRGLPVAEGGISRWYPPEFLPRTGKGVLFLDEINMAPPAMQGIAQQLILDRKVGSYCVPDGWSIWAAGNRKTDRAAVFEMPSALANRFIHLDLQPDLDSFKVWGLSTGMSEEVLAFLSFRPALLHQIDAQRPAWPSPRSWVMANALRTAGLSVEPAIGPGAAGEFEAFCSVYENLPDIQAILDGEITEATFPHEASVRYATVLGLMIRADTAQQGLNGMAWLVKVASAEWVQLYAMDLFRRLRDKGQFGELLTLFSTNDEVREFTRGMRELILSV